MSEESISSPRLVRLYDTAILILSLCVRSESAGSFVVVDASGRDQALESGSKIACVVSRVLFHEQVRALQKSGNW